MTMRSAAGTLEEESWFGDVATGECDEAVGVTTDIAIAKEKRCSSAESIIQITWYVFVERVGGFFKAFPSHNAMATKQAGKQANREAITLKGSAALVTEFFKYAVN